MGVTENPNTVLHISPHCDDELIGAPAFLMALRDAGWTVVNLVSSLGSANQYERRLREVTSACKAARFELRVFQDPLDDPIAQDKIDEYHSRSCAEISRAIVELSPKILVSSSPLDGHPGHVLAGRSTLQAIEVLSRGNKVERLPVVWLWGLWADLPYPNLIYSFGEERLLEIDSCLSFHLGELSRNDYRRLVRGRATMNSILGPERVFGFGSEGISSQETPYVELVAEFRYENTQWYLSAPRWFDPSMPIGDFGGTARDPYGGLFEHKTHLT